MVDALIFFFYAFDPLFSHSNPMNKTLPVSCALPATQAGLLSLNSKTEEKKSVIVVKLIMLLNTIPLIPGTHINIQNSAVHSIIKFYLK